MRDRAGPLRIVRQKAAQRPESAIRAAVLRLLQAHAVLCWPVARERAGRQRASHIGFRGHPDIAGVLPGGRACFVEVKKKGTYETPAQARALHLLRQQGAATALVRSVDEARAALVTWGLRR